jgi:glycine dehydrogenase subunit 2
MGFDVTHLNLHKTFSTPHGGGGPGSGPVGVKTELAPYLPGVVSAGKAAKLQMKAFYGNFSVMVKALTYLKTLGRENLRGVSEHAVLNANYLMHRLKAGYTPAGEPCMHEFVLCLEDLKERYGVSALDVAKALIDHGIHPPTMYFPLIVHEALMFEPTETESMETLDHAADVMLQILTQAKEDPESMHHTPSQAVIGRPDEVAAARSPILRYHPRNL